MSRGPHSFNNVMNSHAGVEEGGYPFTGGHLAIYIDPRQIEEWADQATPEPPSFITHFSMRIKRRRDKSFVRN